MNHKNLEVWKKSMDLVLQVYQITNLFPDTEKFGLTSQMRRAAVSIPSNIAEGAARKSDKEFIQFLYIALGSLAEVETQYLIAIRLQYLNEDLKVDNSINEVKSLIIGMKNYLLKK
ncbi:four helix bundle protein [Flavobacterium sp. LM5]|jgi:four helix bundle protein|uniref:four helix bundle protein n=1 Tax=Flavobacterium sp. LM5 TaxID=1938610 RepID=UPI000991D514|nr:four helix bundle protein [Flavobacterium sp. LM5]OOV29289.1 four helix bundle protein [Flavobacterium sp. LM5]